MAKLPKYIRNTGKPWTKADVNQFRELAKENTATRVIGPKLGRTEDAVRSKRREVQIRDPYIRDFMFV